VSTAFASERQMGSPDSSGGWQVYHARHADALPIIHKGVLLKAIALAGITGAVLIDAYLAVVYAGVLHSATALQVSQWALLTCWGAARSKAASQAQRSARACTWPLA
jgi:hypothetical protein